MQPYTYGKNFNLGSNKKIAKAWEAYIDSGDSNAIQTSSVRNIIKHSWQLSKQLGIQPDTERAPTVITAEEISELGRTSDLINASRSALSRMEDVLNGSQHVVVIADDKGRILFSSGHRLIQNKLENINFRPGSDWSEQFVGPNGIGTPLALGRPEIVMGYEHYCKAWQPWVCYGAPIYDVSGTEIKGMIDITGPVEKVSNETMSLTITLAQSITSNLSVAQYQHREKLRQEGKRIFHRWANEAIVILDEYACIVDFNSHAYEQLKHIDTDVLNKPVSVFIPGLTGTVKECIDNNYAAELQIHNVEQPCLPDTLHIKLESLSQSMQCRGAAMILARHGSGAELKSNQDIAQTDNNFHRLGDELIKQTLKQTNHNISRAARILGIDRTTIYRRMRKWQD